MCEEITIHFDQQTFLCAFFNNLGGIVLMQ